MGVAVSRRMKQRVVADRSRHIVGSPCSNQTGGFATHSHFRALICALVLLVPVAAPRAQHAHHVPADTTKRFTMAAMAIGVVSAARPGAQNLPVTEGYLTQPMIMAKGSWLDGRVASRVIVNLEGLTLDRGEINPGVYGEGYVDRRHPHTYLHEAMLGTAFSLKTVSASVWAGKGFVPFGTDDPMGRPFVKYPANHHLSQVIERLQLTGSARYRGFSAEAALFNGDEPASPRDWPNTSNTFDSWAVRLTARPVRGLEVAASRASVVSPEDPEGLGLDQIKNNVAARWEASRGGRFRYGLIEWGRTSEWAGERRAYVFHTLAAEGLVQGNALSAALRVERTVRPEEDRTRSPYRSRRPLLDVNILGRSRWDIATLHVSHRPVVRGPLRGAPFVEASWYRPRALEKPAAIDPEVLFGQSQLWLFSVGMRLHLGSMDSRFGRYGAAR